MASNFKIIRHHNSDNLHLNLSGDFDGSAALELVHVIEDNVDRFSRIFVHTCGLASVLPFGEAAFIRNIRVSRLRSQQLKLTGTPGNRLYMDCLNLAADDEKQTAWVH